MTKCIKTKAARGEKTHKIQVRVTGAMAAGLDRIVKARADRGQREADVIREAIWTFISANGGAA